MGNCCTSIDVKQTSSTGDIMRDNVTGFTLNNEVCLARVVDVYDGDTCTVVMRTSIGVHEWKIRMLGYDSPEKAPNKNTIPDPIERALHKRHGIACGNMLRHLIEGRIVIVHCNEFDPKWGKRLMADLYVPLMAHDTNEKYPIVTDASIEHLAEYKKDKNKFLHINAWMLRATPSQPYQGGTKTEFNLHKRYNYLYESELSQVTL